MRVRIHVRVRLRERMQRNGKCYKKKRSQTTNTRILQMIKYYRVYTHTHAYIYTIYIRVVVTYVNLFVSDSNVSLSSSMSTAMPEVCLGILESGLNAADGQPASVSQWTGLSISSRREVDPPGRRDCSIGWSVDLSALEQPLRQLGLGELRDADH